MHTITFWINSFTVDDAPLRRFDDPENRASSGEVWSILGSFDLWPPHYCVNCNLICKGRFSYCDKVLTIEKSLHCCSQWS
ncbi:unnamed protein product [Microthlaspi erraticum]|uniref:SEP domain-containing protein n=1 Tax=Microthlaspi erraticum TaxID=1685480 RepID=A0A6D2KTQ6_9BRAS|nr:unnamed protein product [Microthlaspi erraticum]